MFLDAPSDIAGAVGLLGGAETIRHPVTTRLDAHDLLAEGLPARALTHLVGEVALLQGSADAMERAIGISLRTFQRRKRDDEDALLSPDQSGRAWKFAEILSRATDILGSRAAAEGWLTAPAIGLDRRRPIDLLATPAGVEAIEDYLTRMDYGVYA